MTDPTLTSMVMSQLRMIEQKWVLFKVFILILFQIEESCSASDSGSLCDIGSYFV
jgi:hypothetical protein